MHKVVKGHRHMRGNERDLQRSRERKQRWVEGQKQGAERWGPQRYWGESLDKV